MHMHCTNAHLRVFAMSVMVYSTKVLCPENLLSRKSQRYKDHMSHYVDIQHLCIRHRTYCDY